MSTITMTADLIPSSSYTTDAFIRLNNSDIVCGRGGLANKHPGNRLLRRICNENKGLYHSSTDANFKQCLIVSILTAIQQNNGGRFLTRQKGEWKEISEKKAKEKVAQLLRDSDESDAITTATLGPLQPRTISPEPVKDLYTPYKIPCEELTNLLQQPLLEPTLVEESILDDNDNDDLFDNMDLLEALESELATCQSFECHPNDMVSTFC